MCLAAQISGPYGASWLGHGKKECDDCWDVALNEVLAATERFVATEVHI